MQRTGRTRNKKVNYAALHSGGYEDGPNSSNSASPSPSTSSEHISSLVKIREMKASVPGGAMGGCLTSQTRVVFPEEREIRRLRNKQKKRPLMRKDREKLKRLRDKLRRKLRKLRNEMEKVRTSNVKVKSAVETNPNKQANETITVMPSPVIVEDVAATEFIEVVSPGPPAELLLTESRPEEVHLPPVAEDLNVEEHAEADVEETTPPVEQEMPAIVVHHRDNTSRTSQQRNRWQEGYLQLSLYSSKDSPCITCNTCRETFSVKKFIKHLHHQNKVDELCEVTLAQKLEPKCPAPMLTWQIWEQFEKRQAQFEEIAIREKQTLKLQRQEQQALNPPNQRLSGRVRKRKQLHPMESYVYAANQNKRARVSESDNSHETTEHITTDSERITPKDSVNVEKIR